MLTSFVYTKGISAVERHSVSFSHFLLDMEYCKLCGHIGLASLEIGSRGVRWMFTNVMKQRKMFDTHLRPEQRVRRDHFGF